MKMRDSAAFYSQSGSSLVMVIFLIHFGHSCYTPSIFEVHLKYSSCILYEFFDVRTIFGSHSDYIRTTFEAPSNWRYSESNRTAIVQHSRCILDIMSAFSIFLLGSNYIRVEFKS